VPPTQKPQTKPKEVEESKKKAKTEKKKAVAVAALLLLLFAAPLLHAQQTTTTTIATNTTAANKTGDPEKVVGNIVGWTVGGLGLVVTFFGAMFWAAVGIAIFHIAMSYIAPTRFQRLGAMWDAVERMKDVAIGLAVLFAIFYGVMAVGAIISGNFSTETAWDLFVKIVSKPLVDLYGQITQALSSQTGTSPPGGSPSSR
jgi:hypothetical protein